VSAEATPNTAEHPPEFRDPAPPRGSRRTILVAAGAVLVSGCQGLVAHADKSALGEPADDVALLNTALAVEYEAIAVYELLLTSDRLEDPARDFARHFREDHAKHVAALVGSILKRGGRPVEGKSSYGLRADELREQADALRLAAAAEKAAAALYLGAVPAHFDRELARQAASIMSVETMHWSTLRQALGEPPVPTPFFE
jgi:rubrerythrin